jgi:hypothetical protein
MVGKKGRSGRRRGSFSRFKNPVAYAGIHLIGLKRWWQAGVPIQIGPDRWLVQPSELGCPVPSKVEHALAECAIAHIVQLYAEAGKAGMLDEAKEPVKPPLVEQVMAWAANYRVKPRAF